MTRYFIFIDGIHIICKDVNSDLPTQCLTCSFQEENWAWAAAIFCSQNQAWETTEERMRNNNKIKTKYDKPWGRLRIVLNWYLPVE